MKTKVTFKGIPNGCYIFYKDPSTQEEKKQLNIDYDLLCLLWDSNQEATAVKASTIKRHRCTTIFEGTLAEPYDMEHKDRKVTVFKNKWSGRDEVEDPETGEMWLPPLGWEPRRS